MSGKKVQAEMQVNVSFLGDATKLIKSIESKVDNLQLGKNVTKGLYTELQKTFKDIYSDFDKLGQGLSKKGLNTKQYTSFFNELREQIHTSVSSLDSLGEKLKNIYSSPENKQGIKDLKNYSQQLERVLELEKRSSRSEKYKSNAINKMKDELGIDYNLSKRSIKGIAARMNNKQELTASQKQWIEANNLTEEQLVRMLELYKQIDAHIKDIAENNEKANEVMGTDKGGIKGAKSTLKKNIENAQNNTITSEEYKGMAKGIKETGKEAKEAGEYFGESGKFVGDFNMNLKTAEEQAKTAASVLSTLKEIGAQFGIVFSASTLARGIRNLINYSLEFYKSLDSALNQIYVVSNLSSSAVDGLKSRFINMAKDTGMALDDITKSAVLFYQQGLNTQEVLTMTEVTSQFAKVAGIDATDAADKLTAAVNGYCLAAENAIDVADKFNKVAAASAADINELSTAFSKAAAQANQAGVSMDNYLAYIATMEEATREAPENIGTSLKTIFSRMQQIKTGENTDDNVDVNQVETALRSVNIQLRDADGQLRDLEDVFAELGPKWNSLDRNTQAYLGTIVAGTRQQSRFITLMQNWDRVLELASESEESAGQQALMHAKAMDSIESKLQQLNVAWQEFVSNLTDSKMIKGVIDLLKGLVNTLNSGIKPLNLITIGIIAMSGKLKGLQDVLAPKVGVGVASLFATGPMAMFGLTDKGKEKAIAKIDSKINKLNIDPSLPSDKQKDGKKFANLQEARAQILAKDTVDGVEQFGHALTAAGAAATALGMALSDTDLAAGTFVSTLGGAGAAVGQMLAGNWVGGIVTLTSTIVNCITTIVNWGEHLDTIMDNAIDNIGKAVEKVNNTTTQLKSSSSLIKKYEKLYGTIGRTSEQQKQLNDTIQKLGDIHDVEVLTDQYGNLSINIDEVKDKILKMEDERNKAIKELNKVEQEEMAKATTGLWNENKIGDAVNNLFISNGSDLRGLLSGIEDGMKEESRSVSNNVATTLSANLKDAIMNEVKTNNGKYIIKGLTQSIMDINDSINKSLDSNDWSNFYDFVDNLQQNIDDMSFNDIQNRMSEFYNTWSGKNKITQDEWDLLADSINNTVFENKSLLEFYSKINDMNDTVIGDKYQNQLDDINNQLKEYEDLNRTHAIETAASIGSIIASIAGAALIMTGVGSGVGAALVGLSAATMTGVTVSSNNNAKRNAQKKELEKRKKEIEEEQKERYKKIAEDNPFINSEEDAKKYVVAIKEVGDALQKIGVDNQNYLGTLSTMLDFSDVDQTQMEELKNVYKELFNIMEQQNFADDTERANFVQEYLTQKIGDVDSAIVSQKLQKIVDESFNNLAIPSFKNFTQIGNELKSITEDFSKMNDIIQEINDNGSISLDTFIELAGILDGIDLENLGKLGLEDDVDYIGQYIDAVKNLNLAIDADTGSITMNGEAIQSLQKLQEIQTKSKIAGMIAELQANKSQTEVILAGIDAQIEGTEAAIKAIDAGADSSISADEIKAKADAEYVRVFDEKINGIKTGYGADVNNTAEWATASIKNIAVVAEAWGRYFRGLSNHNPEDLLGLRSQALSATKDANWSANVGNYIDIKSYTDNNDYEGLKEKLNSYKTELSNSRSKYQAQLDITNTNLNFLNNLYKSDLSKLGTSGSSGSSSGDTIEQYIGKLKEIYNILNRIQVLEHRLSMLDSYGDVAIGKEYGKFLQERVNYNEQLIDQYMFLTNEQKQFTNGYKDFINSVEGLEGVFDFDKYGQIIINWEKYSQLQDTAAKGEMTLKEKADDVYDTYTSMFKDLQGYFDNTIKYLKTVIDLENEQINAWVKVENKMANAVQEIYKKILDERLKAIDKEIKALDDLKKAREEASKERQNSKEITNLQTDIQRALMDTSGASDIDLIKAKEDLDNKLEKIAEDKYSQALEDIKEQLNNQKEGLQEEFDELFENLDWLFAILDEDFMVNEERLLELIAQTDEWAKSSETQRRQLKDELSKDYGTYMSGLQGGKTIGDVYDSMVKNTERITQLEEALKTELSKGSYEIANTIAKWQNKAGSSSGGSSGGGGGSGSSSSSSLSTTGFVGGTVDIYRSMSGGRVVKGESGLVFTSKLKTGTSTTDFYGNTYYSLQGYNNTWISEEDYKRLKAAGKIYAKGGMANFTGPAWLDGTAQHPEAVLNPLQTEHFIKFTNTLDKLYTNGGFEGASNLTIGTIEFNVDSMSSPEDGKSAFDAFVERFKEIGNQTGLKINTFKNTL